ncbi:MAG: hypothetical protein JKY56_13150 [Kofleriaceae bacterium]|nr:hypothetical protein [Kofleriaceae bacterium]
MSIDTAKLIRQAAVHIDEPTLSAAYEVQLLSAIRNRQERGRRHRWALMSACGAIAMVMLFYVQSRSPSPQPSARRSSGGETAKVEPVSAPIADPVPSVEQPDLMYSVEDIPDRDTTMSERKRVVGDTQVKTVVARSHDGEPLEDIPEKEVDETPSVKALWGLVDHQRAGRHYSQAITTLEMLLATYPHDSRAFLAAFTLGRTLEAAGKDLRRVARSYERAYDLAPAGPLARDSLTRALKTMQKTTHSGEVERLNHRLQKAFGEEDAAEQGKGQSP